MTRIHGTLRTISLLSVVLGVTSLASGQQNGKPTNPSPPPGNIVQPQRPQPNHPPPPKAPPHSQAKSAPPAKTPPAANSAQPINQPASAPNASPGYVLQPSAAATGKAGTKNGVGKDSGRVEVSNPSVAMNHNAPVTGHSSANAKITPPMRPAYAL